MRMIWKCSLVFVALCVLQPLTLRAADDDQIQWIAVTAPGLKDELQRLCNYRRQHRAKVEADAWPRMAMKRRHKRDRRI